jgi:hypothetical protein
MERKLFLPTQWVREEAKLASLFDRSPLENVVCEPHCNELCDGGEECALTRGLGGCYTASDISRALLDPYWLKGAKGHSKRTRIAAVAFFQRDPLGRTVQKLEPSQMLATLEHACLAGPRGGTRTVPWLNDALFEASQERQASQRQLFQRLLSLVPSFSVNSAAVAPSELTPLLLDLVK